MNIATVSKNEFDKAAAKLAVDQIKSKAHSVIGFATGNTTVGLHHTLADMIDTQNLDISGISTFNLDEYVGLSKDNPASCYYRMNEQLFRRIHIKPEQIHFIDGLTIEPEQECVEFEKQILSCGGIDLQFVGIGLNGHIGFNEPYTPFNTESHVIDIDLTTRESKIPFFGSLEKVPTQGITMGIKTIMMCRKIVLLAKGLGKAEIIKKALHGPITPEVPASVLQLHPNLTVILDEDAAGLLG